LKRPQLTVELSSLNRGRAFNAAWFSLGLSGERARVLSLTNAAATAEPEVCLASSSHGEGNNGHRLVATCVCVMFLVTRTLSRYPRLAGGSLGQREHWPNGTLAVSADRDSSAILPRTVADWMLSNPRTTGRDRSGSVIVAC
jgi:hypothetical protein